MEYEIKAELKDTGYCLRPEPDVIVRRIAGVARTYGPGGWGIGIIPAGSEGRQEQGGPMVPGPWGFLTGLAGVIDNYGGTGAEHQRAREENRLIEQVEHGDVLVLGGQRFLVNVTHHWGRPTGADLVAQS